MSICFSLCSRFCLFAFHFNGCSWTINSAIITFCASANRFYSHFLRLHYSLAHHRYRYTYLPSFFLSLSHFCIIINIVSLRDIVTAIYSFFSNEMKNKKKRRKTTNNISPPRTKNYIFSMNADCVCVGCFILILPAVIYVHSKRKLLFKLINFHCQNDCRGAFFIYIRSIDWKIFQNVFSMMCQCVSVSGSQIALKCSEREPIPFNWDAFTYFYCGLYYFSVFAFGIGNLLSIGFEFDFFLSVDVWKNPTHSILLIWHGKSAAIFRKNKHHSECILHRCIDVNVDWDIGSWNLMQIFRLSKRTMCAIFDVIRWICDA